jgi:nucleoside-diphosphate kinase
MERTFVFIKPDHTHVADQILEGLDKAGTRVLSKKVGSVPKNTVEEHYAEHKGKNFFNLLVNDYTEKAVVLAIYEGDNVIQNVMDICGPTLPTPGTLRGRFSDDTYDKADAENRSLRNAVHRSDSMEAAEREIAVWKEHIEDL